MHAIAVVAFITLMSVAPVQAEQRITRERAVRFILDDYVVQDCLGYSRSRSGVYRRMFKRALAGDRRSLLRVFRDPLFHSGDNEAWGSIPGCILYVVGDARFADFVTGLASEDRHWALTYIPVSAPFFYPDPRGGMEFFRREFPRTYRLYADDDARKKA